LAINPIIKKTLKKIIEEDPSIPKDLENLIDKLLSVEDIAGHSTGGIDKLYDQIFKQFIKHEAITNWSRKYVQ
jgi:hypothetical protein